ncbi:MAG: helix-turn-helix domain-containing protein [Devosia sp.]|nr:helix-turn-helix domain-containing protein [Devosia sp.]
MDIQPPCGRTPLRPGLRQLEKIALTIEEAARAASISRSRLYEMIKTGLLNSRKNGRQTLILADDLKAFIASLPASDAK